MHPACPSFFLPASSSASNNYREDAPPTEFPVVLRRGAVDLNGTGDVRSDYWHRGLRTEVVSRNHSQFPGIHFFPKDGVGSGVAMTECEYCLGVAVPTQSIFQQLPSQFQQVKSGSLIISWPGYQHLKWKHQINFVHTNGFPLSVSEMACQVAYIWRRFYRAQCDGMQGSGIRLGPTSVSYNHLRLHQIYSSTGRTWQAEVSYVIPP